MRQDFLPFTRPAITESDIHAVVDVLRSGWITNGPKNQELEQGICELTGSKYAIALSSATAGMHLLLKAMKIGPGDEVITPSMTWVSMVNMIVLAGATPVFCDVDKDTMLVTPESVKQAITPRTRLIVPVHFAGAPCDLDGIRAVAGSIPVVEDAAHALGTYYKGRHVGQGNSAIYSLHAIKNVTAGEGGIFCTDDKELADEIRLMKFHGIKVDAFDRENRGRAPQAEVFEPGFKYNLTDMQAALAASQLQRVVNINRKRQELAMRYRDLLADVPGVQPLSDPAGYGFTHAWHLFIVRVTADDITRDEFMSELNKRNIGTGLHFRCAHLQRYYREVMGFKAGMLPNTEFNSDRICSLPLFPDMKREDVDDVAAVIREVLAH